MRPREKGQYFPAADPTKVIILRHDPFVMSPYRKPIAILLLAASSLSGSIPGYAMNPEEFAATRTAAEHGSASAQVLVAIAYLNGDAGLARDSRLAARWFEQAALKGNGYAEGRLADLYEAGDGVAQNLKVAADWRERAASRGNVEAQFKLGRMYLEGAGVVQDRMRAIVWLQRAADDGSGDAAYLLAKMYREGLGGPQDKALADHWTYKSSFQGDGGRADLIRLIRNFGHTDDRTVSGAALRRLAEDGDAEAQYKLGMRCYLGRDGENRDPAQAANWLKRAAAQGQPAAMRTLAQILAAGETGVPADPAAAKDWMARADKAAVR